jgi:hypothetical protein
MIIGALVRTANNRDNEITVLPNLRIPYWWSELLTMTFYPSFKIYWSLVLKHVYISGSFKWTVYDNPSV